MVDKCLKRSSLGNMNQSSKAGQVGSNKNLQQGQVCATTRPEVGKSGIVVTSILPILGHYALVLFDSSLSHFLCLLHL